MLRRQWILLYLAVACFAVQRFAPIAFAQKEAAAALPGPEPSGSTGSSGSYGAVDWSVLLWPDQGWYDSINQNFQQMAADEVAAREATSQAELAVAEEDGRQAGIAYSVVAQDQAIISTPTQHDVMDDFAPDAADLEAEFSPGQTSSAPDSLSQIADADSSLQSEENSTEPSDPQWRQAWQKVKDAPQEITAKASALAQQGVDWFENVSSESPQSAPTEHESVADKAAETGFEKATDALAEQSGLQGKLLTFEPVKEGMKEALSSDSEESETPETVTSWALDKVKDAVIDKAADYLAAAKAKVACGGGNSLDSSHCRLWGAANPANLSFGVKQYLTNVEWPARSFVPARLLV